jgi:hypothetical protein
LGAELSKKIRIASAERNSKINNQIAGEVNFKDVYIRESALFSEDVDADGAQNIINEIHFDNDQNLLLFKNLKNYVKSDSKSTKYLALSTMSKFTAEQKNLLEKVFDIITDNYDKEIAYSIVNSILSKI